MIELDAWKMYTINDIEPGDIVAKSREMAKEAEKEAEKAEPIVETPSAFSYKPRVDISRQFCFINPFLSAYTRT